MTISKSRTFLINKNFEKIFLNRYYSSVSESKDDDFSAGYCVKIVKQSDHENFLSTLLLNDKQKRRQAFAVRAFNVEVARVGSMVSEDAIAQMRLQFWKDSVDKLFDTKNSYVVDHPVLREMKKMLDSTKLTKTYMKRLIAARARPSNKPFVTLKELEEYADQTVSSLYYLLLEIWNIKDVNVDHAASHLGKAQGVANLLRAIPLQGRNNVINVPQEILMKHGVSQERIIRDKDNDKGVEECVYELATSAHQHLEKSRSLADKVPKNVRPIFLPAIAIDRFLDRLRKVNFHLTDKRLQQRDQLLPLAYYLNRFRGKY